MQSIIELVKLVRKALDQEGFPYVKIVVFGGFDADKIALFEKEKTPGRCVRCRIRFDSRTK
ncbi:hypothetical protein A3D77_06410 [Candidatus Gottesmanbacteria bacterium RIFCSPHIGHO2_02_FULL_39_11]|uniref:Uncharacterized protein n=1 Tax=Candidatus Gottesmanbacteria bacterium RIFCSPHIGHO2_02_FULL_39_11 TaxID=1798382 RepID=A0A1F5ZWK7_9BACT|nr:MAG: hypothetical protein A3D77_06410 [Candidatus Gottesmanbacteria bacterium RIFCSPHIGHO2_02_FULL_39_11]